MNNDHVKKMSTIYSGTAKQFAAAVALAAGLTKKPASVPALKKLFAGREEELNSLATTVA